MWEPIIFGLYTLKFLEKEKLWNGTSDPIKQCVISAEHERDERSEGKRDKKKRSLIQWNNTLKWVKIMSIEIISTFVDSQDS